MVQKLYKVTCRGMNHDSGANIIHGIAYVVATDPTAAYEKVRIYLNDRELGYDKDRELSRIELLAEIGDYPDCMMRLFL